MGVPDDAPRSVRNRRGEGYRAARVSGGSGSWPSLRGEALNYDLVPTLTSVTRLRIMCALCRDGWSTTRCVARRLDLDYQAAYRTLSGMYEGLMLERRLAANPSWRPGFGRGPKDEMEWDATMPGRICFWRFGRTTAGVMRWIVGEADLLRGMEGDPIEALRVHVQPTLLRPMGLALASRIQWYRFTENELARAMDIGRAMVQYRTLKWRAMGWLQPEPRFYAMDRFRPNTRHAPSWRFTRHGLDCIENHIYTPSGGRHSSRATRASRRKRAKRLRSYSGGGPWRARGVAVVSLGVLVFPKPDEADESAARPSGSSPEWTAGPFEHPANTTGLRRCKKGCAGKRLRGYSAPEPYRCSICSISSLISTRLFLILKRLVRSRMSLKARWSSSKASETVSPFRRWKMEFRPPHRRMEPSSVTAITCISSGTL